MGASKKSVSFGCVRRAPWFPTTSTLDNRKHNALALNGSSSSSTSSAIEGSENLGLLSDPSSLSAAMISLYTGNFEEVKCYFSPAYFCYLEITIFLKSDWDDQLCSSIGIGYTALQLLQSHLRGFHPISP
jgi:hypothetical protein